MRAIIPNRPCGVTHVGGAAVEIRAGDFTALAARGVHGYAVVRPRSVLIEVDEQLPAAERRAVVDRLLAEQAREAASVPLIGGAR